MFATFGVLLLLFWKSRSAPLNYYLLAGFTLAEGYMVGTVGKISYNWNYNIKYTEIQANLVMKLHFTSKPWFFRH
jgi:hydrogenase/urease accessory protein HupE